MTRFAALDFETANNARDSACALGVVIVEQGRIVERLYELIRPPSREFLFTHIHGLSWQDVQGAQRFDAVWSAMARALTGIEFLAAHNAPFDKGVLSACCETYQLAPPAQPFVCTVQLARRQQAEMPQQEAAGMGFIDDDRIGHAGAREEPRAGSVLSSPLSSPAR